MEQAQQNTVFERQFVTRPIQNFTLRFSPSAILATTDVRLTASEPLARSYLSGRIGLNELADRIGYIDVDHAGYDPAKTRRTAFRLTKTTLIIDVERRLYTSGPANGAHAVVFYADGRSVSALRVVLNGLSFARSKAFSLPPDRIASVNDARWNILPNGAALELHLEATQPISIIDRIRAGIADFGDASGWANWLVVLSNSIWPASAILLTLRVLPRGDRPHLRRCGILFAGASAASGFGYTLVQMQNALRPLISQRDSNTYATLVFAGVMVVAIVVVVASFTYLARWLAITDRLPILRILSILGICELAYLYDAFAQRSRTDVAELAAGFGPLVALGLTVTMAILGLAPRRFSELACGWQKSRPTVWAVATSLLFLCAAIGPLRSDSLDGSPHSDVSGAALTAGFAVAAMAIPLFGYLAFILCRGIFKNSGHELSRSNMTVLLAIWCIGLAPSLLTIPLTAILALITIPALALQGPAEFTRIASARVGRHFRDSKLFDLTLVKADIASATRSLRTLTEKFASGDMASKDLAERSLELETFITSSKRSLEDGDPFGLTKTLYTAMPLTRPIAAARLGAAIGCAIGVVTVAIGLEPLLRDATSSELPLYSLGSSLLSSIGRSAVAAAVFVLFLPYFRGSMATTKGLLFGVAALAAQMPTLLLREAPAHAIGDAATILLFYPIVGVVFDGIALRKHVGILSLPRIFAFAGLGNFAAIGTVAASAIVTILSGQLQHVAATALSSAFRVPGSITGGLP